MKYFDYLKKKSVFIIFFAILLFGIGLRVVNFGDLLIFKADQSRDAILMDQAVSEGFRSIPLLGPQIGGTPFRLGPVTYYFQYISGKIFGSSPESFAYPDLLWGILALLFLFLLLRKFFSLKICLSLMALASVSLFLVTFSRFGWNPNGLPFFTILFTWSLLSALEKKDKKRWLLLGIAALSFGIITQLHLIAFLGLGLGLISFLIFSRPLRLREIAFCFAIIMLSNFPILMHEWKTNGGNYNEFKKAFAKKESIGEKHAWYEKVFRAYQENSRATWIIVSGQQNTDTILTRGITIKCDKKCQSALPFSFVAMGLTFFVVIFSYINWKNAEDPRKKRALNFIWYWLGGFFAITIFLAYQIEARFYLGIIAPLFIFFGLAMEKIIQEIMNRKLKILMAILGLFFIISNLYSTIIYLKELSISQFSAVESHRDLRFGTAPKVTLGQLRAIAEESSRRFSPEVPIIVSGLGLYSRSVFYIASFEKGYNACYLRGEKEKISASFNNLILASTDDDTREIDGYKNFGTLSAKFIEAEFPEEITPFPKACLDFK